MSRHVKPRRQGRIHFKPVVNPYPIEMVEKPFQTMRFLNLFGGLTSWQVCKLLFLNQPNPQGVPRGEVAARKATNHKCLRRLKDLGLVATKPIVRADNPLAKWEVNFLTEAGYEALSDYYVSHNLQTSPYRPASALTHQSFTPHHMEIVEVGIAAYAGAPAQGLQVEVWQDDRDLRSLIKSGTLSWPMEPDALLVIKRDDQRQVFFVEVDRHNESVNSPRANSWATKMAKYHRYFAEERRHDRWLKNLPPPQLLVICQTMRRLRGLMEAAAAAGGTNASWFTVADHLEAPDGFFEEIWQLIGLDGYYSPAECFPS